SKKTLTAVHARVFLKAIFWFTISVLFKLTLSFFVSKDLQGSTNQYAGVLRVLGPDLRGNLLLFHRLVLTSSFLRMMSCPTVRPFWPKSRYYIHPPCFWIRSRF